ncbi:MAG: AMP-binding protein [Thermoanaerobaculia bacterium]
MGRGCPEGATRAPEAWLTALFHELLLEGAPKRGRKPALIDAASGHSISFESIPPTVEELVRRLRRLGLECGDVAALLGRNSPQYPLLVLGILAAGGAVAPVNPYFHPHEMATQLRASEASLLVTDENLAETAVACATTSGVRNVVTFGPTLDLTAIPVAPPESYERAFSAEPGDALLAWSVGPGGLPAPARHSHASLSAALLGLAAVAPWRQDDVVFSAISPYDLYGLVSTLALSLRLGMTAVTAARFDAASFAETSRNSAVTVSNVVPTIVRALAEADLADGAVGPLRLLISGGAPLAPHVARACATRRRIDVVQGYGLAEGAGATHVDAPVQAALVESCGRPVAGVVTRVVDSSGRDVPCGAVGELWLRGEQVFASYRGAPEKTALARTPDGWLRTGDLAREDAAGRMTVVGRRKAVVKVRGFQVSPAEVERELRAHPAVRDAAVTPRWDAGSGEESASAEVVVRQKIRAAELGSWLATRVARHKRPAILTVVDELSVRDEAWIFPWTAPAIS